MAPPPEDGESRPVDDAMSDLGKHFPGKQREVLRLVGVLALAPLVSLLISVVVQSLYRRWRARHQALSSGPVG